MNRCRMVETLFAKYLRFKTCTCIFQGIESCWQAMKKVSAVCLLASTVVCLVLIPKRNFDTLQCQFTELYFERKPFLPSKLLCCGLIKIQSIQLKCSLNTNQEVSDLILEIISTQHLVKTWHMKDSPDQRLSLWLLCNIVHVPCFTCQETQALWCIYKTPCML